MSGKPMKKVFSILLVAGVLCVGLTGALAVVPHVHGRDFNHSQHETCPVHQLSLHPLHLASVEAAFLVVFLAACFGRIFSAKVFPFVFHEFLFLRAPPVSR